MTKSPQQRLTLAISEGEVEAVQRAVQDGADVDIRDEFGFPPIVSAAHQGRLLVVRALIAAGADVSARVGGIQDTALHRAVRYGRFCKRGGRELSEAERQDYLPMVVALLDAGSDIELTSEGRPPLSLAAEFASAAVLDALLEGGANPNHDHVLELAVQSRREPVRKVETLLEHGADTRDSTALPLAANVFPDSVAAALCETLLAAGAAVDQVTDGGWSALMHAVAGERLELVEQLLTHNASGHIPIIFDEHQADLLPGTTPASLAEMWELSEILAALAAHDQAPPAARPTRTEDVTGRWGLVAVSTDHEGELYSVLPEDWLDLGADGAFLTFHPDGVLEGHDSSEIEGRWGIESGELVIDNHLADEDALEVSMTPDKLRIVFDYHDDFGRRVFQFVRRISVLA